MVPNRAGDDQCARGQVISVIMNVYTRFTPVNETSVGGGEQRGAEQMGGWSHCHRELCPGWVLSAATEAWLFPVTAQSLQAVFYLLKIKFLMLVREKKYFLLTDAWVLW